ncbi:hypothetical protein [Leucobacter sp. VD1]|uniref:hypothetical protein n=1 Tax=Leucobacter sp. VD1 TaxID=3080381 RepID=UPI003016CC58
MGEQGFMPTSPRLHAKSGKCTLCGERAKLTVAHMPPMGALNRGNAAFGGLEDGLALAYGRPRSGGFRIPAHCEECRARTSPWDDEYIEWAKIFARSLRVSEWKGEREHVAGTLPEVRPGRFIRAALAGMTALAPNLIDTHPELIRAVREGTPTALPQDLRFLMGVAPESARPHVEGCHGGTALVLSSEGEMVARPTLSAVIHFPPFSLLLADQSLLEELPHADCTDFLQCPVEEIADVQLVLPSVDLPSLPADSPVPISMLKFSTALV